MPSTLANLEPYRKQLGVAASAGYDTQQSPTTV